MRNHNEVESLRGLILIVLNKERVTDYDPLPQVYVPHHHSHMVGRGGVIGGRGGSPLTLPPPPHPGYHIDAGREGLCLPPWKVGASWGLRLSLSR